MESPVYQFLGRLAGVWRTGHGSVLTEVFHASPNIHPVSTRAVALPTTAKYPFGEHHD